MSGAASPVVRYRLATGSPCPEEGADACTKSACRYALSGVELCNERGEALPVYRCALAFVDAHGRDGATLEEIGAYMGLTRSRIQQIEAVALERLLAGLRIIGAKPNPQWRELLADAKVEVGKDGLLEHVSPERASALEDVAMMPLARRRLARLGRRLTVRRVA